MFALGPLCGVSDPDAVLGASARCDELGIDTISAGGTIAWAMECAERGLIDAPWLRFGDAGRARCARSRRSARARGSVTCSPRARAAPPRRSAPDSGAFAPHVKGLELPGYEPRTLQAMALGLAVNARGADHNRSGAYEADLSGELDRLTGGDAHARAAIETEDRAAIMDSLILCKFLRGVFEEPFPEWARLLAAVTGWEPTARSCAAPPGASCWPSALFNLREGWTPAEDWLPERFLGESLDLDSGRAGRPHPRSAAHHDRRLLRRRAASTAAGLPGPDVERRTRLEAYLCSRARLRLVAITVPPATRTVTLTIDGAELTVPEGTTIWSAAREAGIEIPALCHDERYDPVGVCRMCVVDVGGRVYAAACVRPCEDGMEVKTHDAEVETQRATLMQLLDGRPAAHR